jgi:hypothetical protein
MKNLWVKFISITGDRLAGDVESDGAQYIYLKDKYKDKKKNFELNFEKTSTENLFDDIDRNSEQFSKVREIIEELFREKGISPDLIDRIAAGNVLCLIGFDMQSLREIQEEAKQQWKAEKIAKRFIHVAKYAQDVYEANGWTWTKVKRAGKARIEEKIAKAKRMQAAIEHPVPKPDNLLEIAEMKDPKPKPARAEPPAEDQKPFSFVEALLEARRKRVK